MGEYARSLAIAKGAAVRWPTASIQFMLSRAAPYAAGAPYPTTLLDSSATFHTAAVIDVIRQWRPDVVIFDNAGRTAQLRAAKRCGARVVYISARRRQRRKAFRLRWMRLIDEHWIAYPEFIAGALSFVERLKLRLMGRPRIRFLDVILERPRRREPMSEPRFARTEDGGGAPRPAPASGVDSARPAVSMSEFELPGDYVLVVPGGGTGHPGAADAVGQFLGAAQGLAAAGIETIFVGRVDEPATVTAATPSGKSESVQRLRLMNPLPQADLALLMRGARLVVVNGGSTLLQSIACGKPCVAAPIAGDQQERIRRCVNAGVVIAATLDSGAMLQAALDLWRNEPRLDALAGRAIALGLTDGVEVALRALDTLVAVDPG